MILKLVLFAVAALLIYKWLGGSVSLPKAKPKRRSKGKPSVKDAEMVECDECGIYVSIEETTLVNGKYICEDCLNKEKAR